MLLSWPYECILIFHQMGDMGSYLVISSAHTIGINEYLLTSMIPVAMTVRHSREVMESQFLHIACSRGFLLSISEI
jgi:hypothetical protein